MIFEFFNDLFSKRTTIKQNGVPFPKANSGVGYIYIPEGVQRDKFIETCLRTTSVTFITEEGQVYNNTPIDKVSINYVEFPDDRRVLGSPIIWINMPYHDKPVVIGVYNALDEFTKIEEGQFSIQKIMKSGHVKISGKGKTGELFISVNHYSDSASDGKDLQQDELEAIGDRGQIEGGKIYIDVQNDRGTAELNLNVKGKVNIVTEDKTYIKNAKELEFEVRDEVEDPKNNLEGVTTKLSVKNGLLSFKVVKLDEEGSEIEESKTSLTYSRELGLNFTDEFNNQIITDKEKVTINSKKFSLNSGTEPMVLGKTLKELLDKFIDAVSKITTATMLGTQPIINKAEVEALKKETEKILSELGFLDSKDSRE